MIIAKPRPLTYISTNLVDEDYPAWDSDTAYAQYDMVVKDYTIYMSYIDDNTSNPTTDRLRWLDKGKVNSRRLTDNMISSQSEAPDMIEFTFSTLKGDIFALLNLKATKIWYRCSVDDTVLKEETIYLQKNKDRSWSDYFFNDKFFKESHITSVPMAFNMKVELKIYNEGSIAKCGHVLVGKSQELGATIWGMDIGLNDYSTISTNEDGLTYLEQKPYAKINSYEVQVPKGMEDFVFDTLTSLRATPTLFLGDEFTNTYTSTIVFGFYNSFSLTLENTTANTYTIDIQSLT